MSRQVSAVLGVLALSILLVSKFKEEKKEVLPELPQKNAGVCPPLSGSDWDALSICPHGPGSLYADAK